MGMFDSVMVPCSGCGKPLEYQSKDGECMCEVFTLENAPTAVLRDIMNWPVYCEKCGQWNALVDPAFPPGPPPRPSLSSAKVKAPVNPNTHFQGMKWWPHDVPFTYGVLETPIQIA